MNVRHFCEELMAKTQGEHLVSVLGLSENSKPAFLRRPEQLIHFSHASCRVAFLDLFIWTFVDKGDEMNDDQVKKRQIKMAEWNRFAVQYFTSWVEKDFFWQARLRMESQNDLQFFSSLPHNHTLTSLVRSVFQERGFSPKWLSRRWNATDWVVRKIISQAHNILGFSNF